MKPTSKLSALLTIGCITCSSVTANANDAYFKFDGDLSDSGGNGYHGSMFARGERPVEPQFVEGRSGLALRLDGASAMRALIDLNPELYPELTISAWVKVESAESSGGYVLSTVKGNGPGFYIRGRDTIQLVGVESGLIVNDALFTGAWQFVALVYDTRNKNYRIHWGNNRSEEKTYEEEPNPPGQAIWVGASSDGIRSALEGVVIDELRITSRALSAEEIAELRDSANQPNSVATAPEEPTTTTNAQGTTGISAITSQEPTNINSNADPEFIEGRTTSLIGIAGRWQGDMVIGSGLNFATSTLLIDFYGPDSDLSGHLRVTETNVQGGELDESLTSVSKTGNTVAFSSPSIGEIVGQLSEDGSTITLPMAELAAPLTLKRIATGTQFLAKPDGDLSESTYAMAGEWRSTQVFGGAPLPEGAMLALLIDGPDALLSGKMVSVIVPSLQGAQVIEEPLTRIVKDGQNLRISSTSLGNTTGMLSADDTALVISVDTIADGGLIVFEKQ